METKFYEVELWKDYKDENGNIDGGITDYSLCIKGIREPSIIEAEHFLAEDIKALGYKGVTRVFEIPEEEAHNFFDTEHIENWRIFGKENKEMKDNKEEKRIIDKAITFANELISLLDEGLRKTNPELFQEITEEIEILYNLKDKLYDTENKLYNSSEKVEFALIGYCEEFAIHGELYWSTDIEDVLKKAKNIKPLCEIKTLRNPYGDVYDYLEVIQRDNPNVVYWRSYKETK